MVDVPRKSQYPMVHMDTARDLITRTVKAVGCEKVPLSDALNRILATPIVAPHPIPYFRASTKDGYAICYTSTPQTTPLPVHGVSTAGMARGALPERELSAGEAAYITTGARLPAGTDTVVMAEHTEAVGTERIRILRWPSRRGADVREVGSDVEAGEVVVAAGMVLGAAEVGLAAGCGVGCVEVRRRVRVGVMSTGDEVVDVEGGDGAGLQDGKIADCNRPMLLSAVREALDGMAVGVDLGIVADEAGAVREVMEGCGCDVVVSSGGVSMGKRDVVKGVLEEVGEVHFGRVIMKPGKPLTFATGNDGERCFVGLPGNPVSAFVCFHLAVVVAVKMMAGWERERALGVVVEARARYKLGLDAERPEFHRAILHWEDGLGYVATSTGAQASSRLASARSANALLCLPAGEGHIEAGEVVKAIVISHGQYS